jgi:hypothetical protein
LRCFHARKNNENNVNYSLYSLLQNKSMLQHKKFVQCRFDSQSLIFSMSSHCVLPVCPLFFVLCCVVLCSAVQCSVVLCCAVLCSAVHCCPVLCSAVQCSVVLCCAVQCCPVLCSAVLSCAVLCCAVQCSAVLCCVYVLIFLHRSSSYHPLSFCHFVIIFHFPSSNFLFLTSFLSHFPVLSLLFLNSLISLMPFPSHFPHLSNFLFLFLLLLPLFS